ncbi:MAG: PstS family phosphate ABC transporter substrate-binding protein [Armatimonadota bacterium]
MSGRKVALALVVVGLCLSLTGSWAGPSSGGTIRISGAWALYPMVVKWAEVYRASHPKVRIDLSAGGAGKGAADALGGLVDIGMVSRAVHPDEVKKGGWYVPVAKDAVFPTINSRNPYVKQLYAKGIKRSLLVAIWNKKITNWSQIIPGANAPLHVYTRSDACGAAETWAAYLGCKQENLKGTAVYGDPGVAEAIRRDPYGIGFNNLNYCYDARSGKPVPGIFIAPIDINGDGKIARNEHFYTSITTLLRGVGDGAYPSPPARALNFLCKGKPNGATRDFIKWVLTEGQKYEKAAGYVALSGKSQKAALSRL